MTNNELFKKIFAKNQWNLSQSLIRSAHCWRSIPVLGYPDLMQCEWLADALHKVNQETILCLSSGCHETESISVDTHKISEALFERVYLSVALTNLDVDFILFKNDTNDYYIIAGTHEFMKCAYRATDQTAQELFLGSAKYCGEKEKTFLFSTWEKYYR